MKKKWLQVGFHLFLLITFIALLAFITIKFGPEIIRIIKKPQHFRDFLASYKSVGILIYIFFQMLHVLMAAIPGEFIQIAGGYVYGTFFGALYSITGVFLGSVVAFYISRLLGFRLVKDLVSEQSLEKLNFLINNPKSEITMFIILLIPGIPKDVLVYLAGMTPIKPLNFFIIFSAARFPSILVTSFLGANLQKGNYILVAVMAVFAGSLFVLGVIYKDRVFQLLHKLLPVYKEKATQLWHKLFLAKKNS
jgi:uncharacterized membrane protein YdjX (TVP38/TMEM64 family)